MALKDKWKDAGKGTGAAFKGLGKAMVRTVKKGVNKLDDDPNAPANEDNLKEHWSDVGHEFGDAGKAIGRAFSGTAKRVADDVDDTFNKDKKKNEEKPEDASEDEVTDG